MAFMKVFVVSGILLSVSPLCEAQQVVSPQVRKLLKSPLKQTKVTDCGAAVREVQWGTTRISYTPEGLRLDGLQSSGATWEAILPASNVLKCEVWSAVLKTGGKPSLLVFKAPETGGIEGGELTVLAFDAQNRPFPWKAAGAFTSTGQGITQVTSDETTGVTKLLVPVRQGDPHAATVDVTSLFKWNTIGFSKVIGPDSTGAVWPLISGSDNALSGKERLLTSTVDPTTADASTKALSTTSVVKISERTSFSEEEPVILSNGQKTRFPAMLVLDRADGSRAIFVDEHVVEGVDEVIKLGASVTLQGTSCEDDECRPFVMLAKG